ncbi:MAG TPA: hypothetical protein VGK64_23020 [Bryobacteraceae bacterium]
MDNPPVEKRFIFNGAAVALAAHIRRPNDLFIRAVAPTNIPVTGGLAEGQASGQNFHEIISFESASSRTLGDFADTHSAASFTNANHGENGLSTHTFVESSVSGLKVDVPLDTGKGRRVFAVKQLRVRLESASDRRNPIAFRSLETTFAEVSVDEVPLKVITVADLFSQHETKAKLVQRYEKDADFRKRYGNLFFSTGRRESKNEIPNSKGLIYGTVVAGLEWQGKKPDKCEIIGTNRLKIEGLGSVYFGEIFIDENYRRITLIRFQLGSTYGGDMAACEAQGNGSTWPPSFSGF